MDRPWHPGKGTSGRDLHLGIRTGEVGQGFIFHGESRGHLASCSFPFGQVVMRPARQAGLGKRAIPSPRALRELGKEAAPGTGEPRFLERGSPGSPPWGATGCAMGHSQPRGDTQIPGKGRDSTAQTGSSRVGYGAAGPCVVLVDLGSNAAVLARGRGCSNDVLRMF